MGGDHLHNGTSRLIRGIKEQNKKLMVVIKVVASFYLFIFSMNYITANTNASFTNKKKVNISIHAWVEETVGDATTDQLEQNKSKSTNENTNQKKENQSETTNKNSTIKPEKPVDETSGGDSTQTDSNTNENSNNQENQADSPEQEPVKEQTSQPALEKDSKAVEAPISTQEPTNTQGNNQNNNKK